MSEMQGWGTGDTPDPTPIDPPPAYTPPPPLLDPSGRYEIFGGYPPAQQFEQDGSQFRQPARSWTRLAPPLALTVAVAGDRVSINVEHDPDVLVGSFEGQLDTTGAEFGRIFAVGTYEGLGQGWSDQNSDVNMMVEAARGSGAARVEFYWDPSWHSTREYAQTLPMEPGTESNWPTPLDDPPLVMSYPTPSGFGEPSMVLGGMRFYVRTGG